MDARAAEEPPGLRAGWFNVHKSIGLTLGVLMLGRLWWRARHAAPALKEFFICHKTALREAPAAA